MVTRVKKSGTGLQNWIRMQITIKISEVTTKKLEDRRRSSKVIKLLKLSENSRRELTGKSEDREHQKYLCNVTMKQGKRQLGVRNLHSNQQG